MGKNSKNASKANDVPSSPKALERAAAISAPKGTMRKESFDINDLALDEIRPDGCCELRQLGKTVTEP